MIEPDGTRRMEPTNERAVIEELWKRARPSVASFIASVVPNLDDADDLQQRVAVAVVRKFADFDRSRSFAAWAIGIAGHGLVDRMQLRY